MDSRCPICGETAPEPATLCLRRVAGIAEQGAPCDYSQEGEARFANEIGVEKAALVMGALDQPPASSWEALAAKIECEARYAREHGFEHSTILLSEDDSKVIVAALRAQSAQDQPTASSGKALTGKAQGAWQKPGTDDPWIKVEDQLPGEQGHDSEEVIVFLNGHCDLLDEECRKGGAWGHRFGWFDAGRQCFRVHGRPDASVTHWMPKPPVPRGAQS